VLFQSSKRIAGFIFNNKTSSDWIAAYYFTEFEDMTQALLQIMFYYYAKDVINDLGQHTNTISTVAKVKNSMTVISISNFFLWIIASFIYPEMSTTITPSTDTIDLESWPVYDNVVNPLAIFFRFNSALLFLCIRIDWAP